MSRIISDEQLHDALEYAMEAYSLSPDFKSKDKAYREGILRHCEQLRNAPIAATAGLDLSGICHEECQCDGCYKARYGEWLKVGEKYSFRTLQPKPVAVPSAEELRHEFFNSNDLFEPTDLVGFERIRSRMISSLSRQGGQ